ncbi:MAG: CoA-binding protein [Chloroflexota bacterium]|nr:CoA-binding protein [Chloroflexota bacterium]
MTNDPWRQMSVTTQLTGSEVIAVVGISPNPERPSHYVAKYLQEVGYKIIPVNPMLDNVLGENSYPDLKSISSRVDMVVVFRRPEHVLQIVKDAVTIEAKYIWLQDGIVNLEAYHLALNAGLSMVMDN